MKQYSNRIYILFFIFLTMFSSCTKNTDIEKTAVELFNEYKANPNDFTDYYKNKRILLTGTTVYASQNKHHPGNKYSILFNSGTENEESGIVCNFKSKTLGSARDAKRKTIKVYCVFDKIYKSEHNDYVYLKNGKMIE